MLAFDPYSAPRTLPRRSAAARLPVELAIVLGLLALLPTRLLAGEQEWKQYMQEGAAAYKRRDYRAGIAAFERAAREAEAFGESDSRLAFTLNELATQYHMEGRVAEAEALYRRSLEIYEKARGAEHPDVAIVLNNLGWLYVRQHRNAEAELLYRRSLGIREKALGPDHPDVAIVLDSLAWLCGQDRRFAEAASLRRRSLGIYEKSRGPEHPEVAERLASLASEYQYQGRHADAEPLLRRSLAIVEKAFGPEHPNVAQSLVHLAALYYEQGRYAEAESLDRRALAIMEKARGPEHPDVTTPLGNLAAVHMARGRYADAEPLYGRLLAIEEKATGPEQPRMASRLNSVASLYRAQGRYAEAETLVRRSLAIFERVFGAEDLDVASSLNLLATVLAAQGRYAEAEPLYRRSLGILENRLGPEHPYVATSLGNLASVYRAQNNVAQALEFSRRATDILAARFDTRTAIDTQGVISEQRKRSGAFENHVALAYAAMPVVPARARLLLGEAFDAAQLARASDTAEQLSRMTARQAAANDGLADVVRLRQDLAARWGQIDSTLIGELSKPAAGRQAGRDAQLREEQQVTRRALEQLDARIERDFPQYRELTDPRPLGLDAAQKLLARDEALVAILVTAGETYVWIVRSGSAEMRNVLLPRKDLAAAVQGLRRQLDLSSGDPGAILSRPFDVRAAHDLYKRLFEPFEKDLSGVRHLIVVPDGPLQSLPLGVLVTELPAAPVSALSDHASVAWLAGKYAITTLPAVGSLRALRAFAKAAPAPDPFSGFGDPVLEGGKGDGRNANAAALFPRGAIADVAQVRNLARLPESAGELRAIAATLKAPVDQLHLGNTATEAQVKRLDLSRFRNIAFATHALMAGEFHGLAEPALVLTPPEKGSDLDDGLLTASEIAQLKLNAEWVILSACNTAAGDGTPGAEGFSGLSKAFFYAGARALLVSHWAVETGAAVALTTRMFEEVANGTSKAEALRLSMLALMRSKDKPYYAHPALWAPFVVVGEGNAARAY